MATRTFTPRVSVLLPVRDAAPWLASALASLARQTLADHEVIAVDDGSRDGSGDILDRAARADRRLVVRHTPARGLPAALDLALSLARGPYVARQDADDLSHRTRLERQQAWLEAHPGVDVLGTCLRLFPASAVRMGMRRWAAWHNALFTHEAMRRELLIDSPLAHGTMMARKRVLEAAGGWHERGWAEDLDLWLRLFARGARFSKLRSTLYGWRQHPASATHTDPRYSRERFLSLKSAALDAGLLRGGRRATLIGVGISLSRWHETLGTRIERRVEMRRPDPGTVPALRPPLVLAVMAPVARERWRSALTHSGLRELSDFIFVA
jgi:glycosyltransferase involved in cell wall biosynthesis